MTYMVRFLTIAASFVLLLNITPSWGQAPPVCAYPGCNATRSTPNFNTAGGTAALINVVELTGVGFSNTAFGWFAMQGNTLGGGNTAIGSEALFANTTGSYNTASGLQALGNNTTGANNTASGFAALFNNTTGNNNIANGGSALGSNTTGNLNAATGFQALQNNTTGNNNTALGAKALRKTLGTGNIAIGYQAGVSLTNGNSNIYIGNPGVGDESQTIRIGTDQTQTFIAGIGNAIVTGAFVEVDTITGQLGIAGLSSTRYKRDIESMGSRSAGVLQLRPVTFAYRQDAPGVVRYGLVAEEVQGVYPELVTQTATGEPLAVRYQELIPMLLNELQRLQKEVAGLQAVVGSRSGHFSTGP